MFHKDLIGRYYNTLIDKEYVYVFRSDRIQHGEIQGKKHSDLQGVKQYNVTYKFRNTFEMLGVCSYDYLNSITFYNATYDELIRKVSIASNINSYSDINANFVNIEILNANVNINVNNKISANVFNRLLKSSILNNTSKLTNIIINRKNSAVLINNMSNSNSYAVVRLLLGLTLTHDCDINALTTKRILLAKKISNTSIVLANANSYKKRVKKIYIICAIEKTHNIEVVI